MREDARRQQQRRAGALVVNEAVKGIAWAVPEGRQMVYDARPARQIALVSLKGDVAGVIGDHLAVRHLRQRAGKSRGGQGHGRPAILSRREGEEGIRRTSLGELRNLAGRAAAGFRALGLAPGDAVALYLPMTAEFVAAYLGVEDKEVARVEAEVGL